MSRTEERTEEEQTEEEPSELCMAWFWFVLSVVLTLVMVLCFES